MTDFMLPAKSDEYSTEIAPQIQNIYSVTKMRGMSPRVIDIFSGAERTLPQNMVKRLNRTYLIAAPCEIIP